MNKTIRYILVFMLFLLLILVRAFASKLFYDPLIDYFKNDYLYTAIPEVNQWKLISSMFFRYSLNSLISLAIIWLLFLKIDILKFSGFFLTVAFMLLGFVFMLLLKTNFESGYLLPFYIRRFIIHPMFLILLLPAFYYQKLKVNKN